MKKFLFYFFLLSSLLVITSCGDDKEEEFDVDAWKAMNDAKYNEIARDPNYKEIESEGKNGSVYYTVLKEGPAVTDIDSIIYYTSKVKVFYKGTMLSDDGSEEIVFDKRLDEDDVMPFYLAVNPANAVKNGPSAVIEGWSVALQHMKRGDHWKVCIPHRLAYGKTGQGTIHPYSTLFFEIEVVDVINP